MDGSADADMSQWIEENYWSDEDEAATSFKLEDMDDLATLVKFYADRPVTMRLSVDFHAQEFSTYATLSPMYKDGGYAAKEDADLSPATAAKKLTAIARSLGKWADKNPS